MRQPAQLLHHQESSGRLMHLPLVLFQALLPHCDPSSPSRKPSSILLLHEYLPTNHPAQLELWVERHRPVVVEAVVPVVRHLGALAVVGEVRRCWA
jgi:hypothetical protein